MEIITNLLKNPIFWALVVLAVLARAISIWQPKGKVSYPYKKVNILTQNELKFYSQLKPIALKHKLQIFAKVRFADIMNVKDGLSGKEYLGAFSRISQKHADFVLLSQSLETICVIELDDKSHDKPKADKNDRFKNNALEAVSIPLIRTRSIDGVEDSLVKILCKPIKK